MITETETAARRSAAQPPRAAPRPLRALVPGVAAVLFAGVQLQAGVATVLYREVTTVPADRLNCPTEGALRVALSLSGAVAQAVFVHSLVAFARSEATGRSRPGRIGAKVMVVGGVVFVGAQCLSAFLPGARSEDPAAGVAIGLFALGSLTSAVGFVLAGLAVIRARRWSSWRRFTPLAVGVAMLALVPVQFTSLLALGVALYGVAVVGFGAALHAEPLDPPA